MANLTRILFPRSSVWFEFQLKDTSLTIDTLLPDLNRGELNHEIMLQVNHISHVKYITVEVLKELQSRVGQVRLRFNLVRRKRSDIMFVNRTQVTIGPHIRRITPLCSTKQQRWDASFSQVYLVDFPSVLSHTPG